jgi:hypothetical protein
VAAVIVNEAWLQTAANKAFAETGRLVKSRCFVPVGCDIWLGRPAKLRCAGPRF